MKVSKLMNMLSPYRHTDFEITVRRAGENYQNSELDFEVLINKKEEKIFLEIDY